jgi:anti-sigma factor RsiW
MTSNPHDKARELIVAERVEGINKADGDWLAAHLETCGACQTLVEATESSIRALRSNVVQIPLGIVSATQARVRRRARTLHEEQLRTHSLWISCFLSWVMGVVSAPLVWEGFKWFGQRLDLPSSVWIGGLALWWLTPTAVVGAVFAWRHARSRDEIESETKFRS